MADRSLSRCADHLTSLTRTKLNAETQGGLARVSALHMHVETPITFIPRESSHTYIESKLSSA
jgi:hypothetical protein